MTGFLNIDKAEGTSSAFAVNKIKWLLDCPCGHMGTLDPLASGVLPVAAGNAARLFEYFLKKQKTYLARFTFGATTDTLDKEGKVVVGGRIPTADEIKAALHAFTGEIDQIPPKFSAKCVNGKRGYELARSGKDFTLPPKRVTVYSFSLLEQTDEAEFSFEIVCGGGTYIRSLARDLALALGTNGYMTGLRRTASGPFTIDNAVSLDVLTKDNVLNYLIPTQSVLPFPVLTGFDERLFHGLALETDAADGLYQVYQGDAFYGLAEAQEGILKIKTKLS